MIFIKEPASTIQRLALVLTLLVVCSFPARPSLDPALELSQYIHGVWQSQTGLPSNSVMAIAQTPDGYLWLGTENGLVRFGGDRFVVFDRLNTPALKTHWITALHTDRTGALWIGTAGGDILRFADQTFMQQGDSRNNSITSIYEDSKGRIWIGSDGGGVLRFENGGLTRFGRQDGLADDSVFAITGDGKRNIWIGTHSGITRYSDERFGPFDFINAGKKDVRSLLSDETGALWIGTEQGLYRLDEDRRLSHFTTLDGLSSNSISSVFQDRAGTIWIGTLDNGIARFARGVFSSFTRRNGFPGGGVWTIMEDETGTLWLGGTEAGLNCLRQGAIKPLGKLEGLQADTVLGLYEDRQKRVWIGSDQGVSVWQQGSFRHFTKADGLPDNVVFSITQDGADNIWVGTRSGVARLKNNGFEPMPLAGAPALMRSVLCAYTGRRGDLWFAGRGWLVHVNGTSVKEFSTADGLPPRVITSLYEDSNGVLWIGTSGSGLLRFENGRFLPVSLNNGAVAKSVLVITGDDKGVVWIGAQGDGLIRLDHGKSAAFTLENGLIDDDIFAIVDDHLGKLWLTSNRGIFSVPIRDLESFAAGKTHIVSAALYGIQDGMRESECNGGFQGTGLRTSDGDLWFPTLKGIATLTPSKLSEPPPPPAVVIQQVLAGGRAVAMHPRMTISAGIKQLELRFASPYLAGPEFVKYKYTLEGFDKGWVSAEDRRSANYTNLSPGTYRFRALACLKDTCTPAATELEITLRATWYQTKTFLAFMIVVLAWIVYLSHLFHVRHLKQRQNKLQALIEERTSELRESRDQLETRVEQRTRQISVANEQLGCEVIVRREAEQKAEAASKAKSQFLTNMSHELRTPMNGVIGMTNLALQLCGSPEQREYLEVVSQSADHLLAVLNDILDFSKIEAGKVLLEEIDFDIDQLLRKLVNTSGASAKEKGLTLLAEIDNRIPHWVIGDPARLRQVLLNLLSNAIKFTTAGAINFSVGVEGDNQIRFSVSDTGIGIAKNQQNTIFQSFVQGDGSMAREYGGTGLGLAISDLLVRQMGGILAVQSTVGVGSTFSFSIVLSPQRDHLAGSHSLLGSERVSASKAVPRRELKILVAEDNHINQRLAKAVLERAGHSVTIANDGLEALAALGESQFDLVLMDVQMPKLDGLSATSAIRTLEKDRRTPIIALTAHAMPGDRERCLEAGMDDYLTKPLNVEQLILRLDALQSQTI